MSILIKKITQIIPILLTSVFLLAAGHFCLQNIIYDDSDHSHATAAVSENLDIQECCQGDNSLNTNSVITQKTFSPTSETPFANSFYTYTSPEIYSSGQSLALPYISPHQFIRKTARILLS